MKIGQCYQCGAKIGRTTANGAVFYLPNMRQLSLIFKYQNLPEQETAVHIPVCKECSLDPKFDKISLALNDNREFLKFLRSVPVPTYDHAEVDPIEGGRYLG